METLARWHEIVRTGDLEGLRELLHEDAVFHSPIVHTPIEGRDLTALYLTGAYHVLVEEGEGFTYVREIVGERDAALEFTTEIEGIHLNGIDLIAWDADGRIVDFKVMIRPKKAYELVHRKMAELLAAAGDAPAP